MYELPGLQPPTKKQNKTSSENEEKQNNYDRNIRERAFRNSWSELAMHFATCRELKLTNLSNLFRNGYIAETDKFKSDPVEYHEL